jgi:hypothetical protein
MFVQYVSEVTLPAEKDGDGTLTDKSFCVYFHPLNAASITDRYGMHSAEQLSRELAGARFFQEE